MTDDPPREVLARRLNEADVLEDRFIPVNDGTKKSPVDHSDRANRYNNFAALDGNYGVYAGGGLVDVDVDDYDAAGSSPGLLAVNGLPDTFTVETPHTDGEVGGHRLYHVVAGEEFETAADALQAVTGNKKRCSPSFGDVQVQNTYVVGPGSQLSGCDKEWCDECATTEGGRYEIAADRPIATITADQFASVLRVDPMYAGDGDNSDTEETPTPGGIGNPPATGDSHLTDEQIVEKATTAANGEKFSRLWRGDTSGYDNDHSRARMALLQQLAFWTRDPTQIDRLFRDSGLYPHPDREKRGKWERLSDDEIQKALAQTTEQYDPSSATAPTADGGTAADDTNTGGDTDTPPPTARGVIASPDHQDYIGEREYREAETDSEKAHAAWNLLRNAADIDVLAAQPSGELYACHDGVWDNTGEQALRVAALELMATDFSKNVLTELCELVRATQPVDHEGLGVPRGTIAVADGLLNLDAASDPDPDGDAIRDLEPSDHALAQLGAHFDPGAECPTFKRFLGDVCRPGDIPKIQEYIGYCLEHWTARHKKALMLFGPTDSGKTIFCTVIERLFGETNTASVSPQYLANQRWGIADLEGKLLNIRHDLDPGVVEKPGPLKELISGDRIMAERKNQDPFPMTPTAKHLWAANRAPSINQEDEALLNRFLIAEFPRTIPKGEQTDRETLLDALTDELPGILNWALEGRARLREQGHFTGARLPGAVADLWSAYGTSIEQFIEQCTEQGDEGDGKIHTGGVHDVYVRFARDRDLEVASQSKLTRELKNAGFRYGKPRVDGAQDRGFFNLKLTDEAPDPSDDDDRDDPGSQSSFDVDV